MVWGSVGGATDQSLKTSVVVVWQLVVKKLTCTWYKIIKIILFICNFAFIPEKLDSSNLNSSHKKQEMSHNSKPEALYLWYTTGDFWEPDPLKNQSEFTYQVLHRTLDGVHVTVASAFLTRGHFSCKTFNLTAVLKDNMQVMNTLAQKKKVNKPMQLQV